VLRNFLRELYGDWVTRMTGPAGLILTVLGETLPGAQSRYLTAAGVVCLIVSAYRLWAAKHRALLAAQAELAARPGESEFLRHARRTFLGLTEAQREFLARLAVEKSAACADPAPLEATGFVRRDWSTGRLSLDPEFAAVLPWLVREWRRARP
jgi:hypothetical protein